MLASLEVALCLRHLQLFFPLLFALDLALDLGNLCLRVRQQLLRLIEPGDKRLKVSDNASVFANDGNRIHQRSQDQLP